MWQRCSEYAFLIYWIFVNVCESNERLVKCSLVIMSNMIRLFFPRNRSIISILRHVIANTAFSKANLKVFLLYYGLITDFLSAAFPAASVGSD